MKPIIRSVILLLFCSTGFFIQAQEKKSPVGKTAAEPQSVMIGKKISPINYVACLDSDGNATAVVRDEPSEAREQAPGSGFSHMIISDGSGKISYSTSNIQRHKWSPLKQLILSKDGIHDMSLKYGQSEYGLLMFSTGKKNTRKYFSIPMLDCKEKWCKKVFLTAAGSDDFARWSTSRVDGSIQLSWLNNKVFYQKHFSQAGWSKTRRLPFRINDEERTRIKFTAFSKNGLAVSWLGEPNKTDNKNQSANICSASGKR